MKNISILGLGAMGSRMAASLLKAGYQVTVWNRSAAKAQPLQALGARAASTPREAALGADVVISMLRDDEASRSAWLDQTTGALVSMATGSIAIESSTLTPKWVSELAQAAQGRGVEFLDAPVAGSRPQAEAGQLIFLVGGRANTLLRAESLLKSMGGAVHHAGGVGSGATVKLMVNALFGIQVAAMAELLGWAKRSGLDAGKALEIIASTPVASPAVKIAGQAMLAGHFAPMFPLELVEKDFGYALAAGGDSQSDLPVVQSTHAVMKNAMARGYAQDNLTVLVKLYV
jgi:3-hydroxyisobutyrate dehydrogenase-like beta-hydroxyacid dehydrogenase